jgi:hypothetical protein
MASLRQRLAALPVDLDSYQLDQLVPFIEALLNEATEATEATFADLIESSSLGTPEARRYRDETPAEVRKQILDGLKDGEVGERD